MTTNKWLLTVKEDPETGDAVIDLPPELLKEAGWQEGDSIVWKYLGNGSWSLSKKK